MFKRVHRAETGQSLIEMALVSGLLLLILGGVLDIGRAFNNYIIITNASREGARYASRFPDDAGGIQQAAIQEAANSGVSLTGGNIAIAGLGGLAGDPIRVTVTYDFSTIMVGILGIETITLRGSTEMVIFGLD